MGKIPFPPHKVILLPHEERFVYHEPLTLEFNTPGHLSHDNPRAFAPNLPRGNFVGPIKLGPYYAVPRDGEILITWRDHKDGKTYKTKIIICAPDCPPLPPNNL